MRPEPRGKAVILCFLIATASSSQGLTVGAKGGVLINQASNTSFVASRTTFGVSTINVRRYTLGPSVEVGLPYHFRIEADALYRRFDRTESALFNEFVGTIYRLAGNDWQFPMLVKFQSRWRRVEPFVSAGSSLRHIWDLQGSAESFAGRFPPLRGVSRFSGPNFKNIQAGIVFAVGVRHQIGPVKVLPEIRYTRWTSIYLQPDRHQLEFLVGLAL